MTPDPADITLMMIVQFMAGNFGLAPRRWVAQLEEIRLLPERVK